MRTWLFLRMSYLAGILPPSQCQINVYATEFCSSVWDYIPKEACFQGTAPGEFRCCGGWILLEMADLFG